MLASPVIAAIPAKGHSQRLADKNLRPFLGRPLVQWTIDYLLAHHIESEVITEDDRIKTLARNAGLAVHHDAHTHTGSMDLILHEWMEKHRQRTRLWLEPTAPLRPMRLIPEVLEKITEGYDSVAVGVKGIYFVFDQQGKLLIGDWLQKGHPPPRTQDMRPQYLVLGSLWAVRAGLEVTNYFLRGRIGLVPLDRRFACDIDYQEDFRHAEHMARILDEEGLLWP